MQFPLPDAALDDRLAFLGTSGSGKTYAAGTAVERLLHSKARVVIVDPLDVWYGLRLTADGERQGWPVIIFGGRHADLPISEASGAIIGETVATMAESCIVSVEDFPSFAARRRFMLAFLEKLYRCATGEPFHLIFDEADLWAPQRSTEPKLLALMENIVRRGRVKGFIPWLISQRPAVISKDVLSQAQGVVAMKLTGKHDRNAIAGWVETTADKSEWKAIDARLPKLARGTGIAWLPGHDFLEEVTFPEKATFDSSRTPTRGEVIRTAALKPIDLSAVKAKLHAVEATPPTKSSALVAPSAPSAQAMREAEDRGRRQGWEEGRAVHYADGYRQAIKDVAAAVASVRAPESAPTALPPPKPKTPETVPAKPRVAAPAPTTAPSDMPKGQRATLIACAQYTNGATRAQLTLLTGYRRSTRDRTIQYLAQRGYVAVEGARVVATPQGIAALGKDYDPLPTGAALRTRILGELPGAQRHILEILIGCYPRPIPRSALDEPTRLARSTRDRTIQYLAARELIAYTDGGHLLASANLFSEAA